MPIQILSNNKMEQLENNLHKTEQSTHHAYMQFILITNHEHMYITSRIIRNEIIQWQREIISGYL